MILRAVAYLSLTADRADLGDGGGVVFTTIGKFMPAESGDRNAVLSDRRNIVVIADEAHRSQYDFIDGFARHMRDALPQASFARTNRRAVFGDYISICDIARAVEDGATVPIFLRRPPREAGAIRGRTPQDRPRLRGGPRRRGGRTQGRPEVEMGAAGCRRRFGEAFAAGRRRFHGGHAGKISRR